MTDAIPPARAADEIAAYRSAAGASRSILSEDILGFLQAGQTVAVAAGSSTGYPVCAIGIGCTFAPQPAGTLARVFLARGGNGALLELVRNGASVGMTLTGVDHRSIQVKARSGRVVAPEPQDIAELHRQIAAHRDWLEIVGFTRAFAETLTVFAEEDVAGIEFLPERVYVQTPGPGAGSRLE
ncbi:hypothetical protein [Mangrovicoccus sp. HB161399]|uniref:hypothetical protein n=1 Tax=Mangrovicoccus sp. HB161399 TaxID=2720392 RepID=UPI001551FEA0|nr:hypothetical protein [Mangrovicoccus sp. HB161399]